MTGEDADPLLVLDDLVAMRLPRSAWTLVEERLRAIDPADRDAATAVSQVVFEARVQKRFQAGRAASTLPPTKQTSALPWVGLVCGGLVLAVGGALGGGTVFVAVALLSVFVFGIALAGSRVAHRSRAAGDEPTAEPLEAVPPAVVARIDALRRPR